MKPDRRAVLEALAESLDADEVLKKFPGLGKEGLRAMIRGDTTGEQLKPGGKRRITAYIDGAGLPRILWHVIAPLCKSGFITSSLMAFFSCWNEFIMANTYLAKESLRTIPFSVIRFQGEYSSDYAVQFACLVLVAIPALSLLFAKLTLLLYRSRSVHSRVFHLLY